MLRQGEDARETIAAVEEKLELLKASLPDGVEIVTTYDRSQLIDASIDNLTGKLIAEFIIVAIEINSIGNLLDTLGFQLFLFSSPIKYNFIGNFNNFINSIKNFFYSFF